MTNQEILTKAITKAIDGGWKPTDTPLAHNYLADKLSYIPVYDKDANLRQVERAFSIPDLIFSHDFAKALWGSKKHAHPNGGKVMPCYQWHLQQMVIAPNPIKYLGANI